MYWVQKIEPKMFRVKKNLTHSNMYYEILMNESYIFSLKKKSKIYDFDNMY